MGCSASSEKKTKHPKEVPIRQKSTLRGKGSLNGQPASGGVPVTPSLQQENPTPAVVKNGEKTYEKAKTKPKAKSAHDFELQMEREYAKTSINDISKEFTGKDDNKIVGPTPEEVMLFSKDSYSTSDWTPLLFAINNKNINAVRYFIEFKKVNPRLQTKKRTLGRDETEFDAEIFPLILAINNQDEDMLDYFWGMNELWDYEHLKVVLQVIFSRTVWVKGIEILLGSQATQDIYNGLSYKDKKQFLIELYYRYLHQANETIQQKIREVSTQRPYALVVLHFLMSEKNIMNKLLIKQACDNIVMEDYAKMKYEADAEFITVWNTINSDFETLGNEFISTAKHVKK
jgi:hypothetical protein